MAGVVDLVDRAVALPPGRELSAVLDALPRAKVPNARLVEVAQARYRQLSHLQAELFADLVEISHTVAVDTLTGDRPRRWRGLGSGSSGRRTRSPPDSP